MGYQQVI